MVRGALFKRIVEETGLDAWAPAFWRGIRTVGLTDSAITGPQQPGPPPQLHPRCLHGLRHLTKPASPAARTAGDALHCRCDGTRSRTLIDNKSIASI